MFKTIRRLYHWARNDPVDDELRGWNWDKPPIKPRAYLGLGVYEIASKYCPTRRDIWLRRKMGIKPEATKPIQTGRLLHDAINLAVKNTIKGIAEGLQPWDIYEKYKDDWSKIMIYIDENDKIIIHTYKSTLLSLLGEYTYESLTTGSNPQPIIVTEYHVDGTPIGLSNTLSIDALSEGVIIDYKYGEPREFHRLSIAGYALALEADLEIPFDYGLLIYVNNRNGFLRVNTKPIYVSNTLRRWFLEERNNIIDMLLDDEEPPIDNRCRESCPFYRVCHP